MNLNFLPVPTEKEICDWWGNPNKTHTQVAAYALGKPEAEVTAEERRLMKDLRFCWLYGRSTPFNVWGSSLTAQLPVNEMGSPTGRLSTGIPQLGPTSVYKQKKFRPLEIISLEMDYSALERRAMALLYSYSMNWSGPNISGTTTGRWSSGTPHFEEVRRQEGREYLLSLNSRSEQWYYPPAAKLTVPPFRKRKLSFLVVYLWSSE